MINIAHLDDVKIKLYDINSYLIQGEIVKEQNNQGQNQTPNDEYNEAAKKLNRGHIFAFVAILLSNPEKTIPIILDITQLNIPGTVINRIQNQQQQNNNQGCNIL